MIVAAAALFVGAEVLLAPCAWRLAARARALSAEARTLRQVRP